MRMNLKRIAVELFPFVFGEPMPVPAVCGGDMAGMINPLPAGAQADTGLVVREIDTLIGELLLGKRKKDVEEEEEFDDEEEDEDEDDLEDDDEDDFDDDEDDEEFEEEFEDDELDDDDDDIFYDDDDDE
jgi:hypothetical protein